MTDNMKRWEGRALQRMIERGSMTLREIMESAEIDQSALAVAEAWAESALERGLIETGWNASNRYNVTAAGRNTARVSAGRFVVSENARDGAPSRRS